MEHHPRAGIAHYFFDFLPHLGLVTVNSAIGTKRLALHKRTFVCPVTGIIGDRSALFAECILRSFVDFVAIEHDHVADDTFFILSFGFCFGHGLSVIDALLDEVGKDVEVF